MADAEHVMVLPDRDAAEEIADALVEEFGITSPRVVREALAGEDDAEDAQWLVLARLPETIDGEAVEAMLSDHGGWLEGPDE